MQGKQVDNKNDKGGIENDSLVQENLMYARRLAKRFYGKRSHTQAELDDIVSSAYLGLCEAASRYDVSKKGKFQTYSYLRIVGSMYDYLTANGGFSRANYKRFECSEQNTNQKISLAKDLRELKSYQSVIDDWGIKLEINVGKGNIDLSYGNQRSVLEELSDYQENEGLKAAIKKLSPDLQKVIHAKYFENKTLEQIAEEFPDYSRSHVSRLVSKALSELRKKLKKSIQ